MTTPRTPLRNDDLGSVRDAQRPLNEALRAVSERLASLPRRQQAWVFFSTTTDAILRTPEYPIAGVLILQVALATGQGAGISAAPWLSWEYVDGQPNTLKVTAAYGTPLDPFFALLEFVEDLTGGLDRNNATGGVQ
jgi:hypothetical protein